MRDREWPRWFRRRIREAIRDNQWLLPTLGALVGLLLAMIVGTGGGPETHRWTVTVDRSRDTLIAALGLAFTALSIVLALASVAAQNVVSHFGSRTLRIYLRASADRWVIGVFVLAATFILTEQFQLRRLDPDSPAPVAGLTLSVVLLVITGATLIWYISSVIGWFRVDKTIARIMKIESETIRSLVRAREGSVPTSIPERPAGATDLLAPRSGYLAEIDTDMMLDVCGSHEVTVVITPSIGMPIVETQPIGWVLSVEPQDEGQPEIHVARRIDVSGTRELGHLLEYGLTALVDIAIIALSPAVNDPNTAVEVIEKMSFLFPRLARAPLGPYAVPDNDSLPRIMVNSRSFGELVELAMTQIVMYGVTDPNVARSLQRFADSLDLLDLGDADRRYVDAFAAQLEAGPAVSRSARYSMSTVSDDRRFSNDV